MEGRHKSKLKELQKFLNGNDGKCEKCGRTYYLTVDHIIPVNILKAFNLEDEIYHWEENFWIICGACNRTKGGFLDISHPKTYKLLKEAIKRSENQLNPQQ